MFDALTLCLSRISTQKNMLLTNEQLLAKGQPKFKKCEHGRLPCRCTLCGTGKGICMHSKRRDHCNICHPRPRCEHGKRKELCVICHGSQICTHAKRKSICKLCRGSQICQHSKTKQSCKICGAKCPHGKVKTKCVECKGCQLCQHEKDKYSCSVCRDGLGYCKHKTLKHRCFLCNGTYICTSCKINIVGKRESLCAQCRPVAKRRSRCKEARVAAALGEWASSGIMSLYTSWNKANSSANKAICGRYRPDFVWDLQFRVVILEVDEHQHKFEKYNPRCELVRVSRIVEGFGIPVHIIRYNPDAFKINGSTRRTKIGERLDILKDKLCEALDRPDLENRIVIQHICFDQEVDTTNFVTTQKFQTLEIYEQWVESTIRRRSSTWPTIGFDESF